jgi:hypothetical protein
LEDWCSGSSLSSELFLDLDLLWEDFESPEEGREEDFFDLFFLEWVEAELSPSDLIFNSESTFSWEDKAISLDFFPDLPGLDALGRIS